MGDAAATASSDTANWGSPLDLALETPMENDVLDVDYMEDEDVASNFLISKDNKEEDFIPLLRVAQPLDPAVLPLDEGSTHQPLLLPPWTCWTCANAQLPGWMSLGSPPWPRPPSPSTRGRHSRVPQVQ